MTKVLLPLLLILTANMALARPLVVYGEDNRMDTFAVSSPLYKRLAQSTAAKIHKNDMRLRGGNVELLGPAIGEAFRLCRSERFYHQPVIANCSGFLVAPDVIATAGHCMDAKEECSQYHWVFNYKLDEEGQSQVTVRPDDVYKCQGIIKQALDDRHDFALVRLDRPVTVAPPVLLASSAPQVGTPVVMIGYPSGLPQKVADEAIVLRVSETEFKADVDAFQMNSGSAVFNALTGELLGILVKGSRDYRSGNGCSEVNVVPQRGPGEGISRSSQFLPYL